MVYTNLISTSIKDRKVPEIVLDQMTQVFPARSEAEKLAIANLTRGQIDIVRGPHYSINEYYPHFNIRGKNLPGEFHVYFQYDANGYPYYLDITSMYM